MKRPARTLRIIAGHWRGRRFRFPDRDIRPTPDRVRETLFNWLRNHVQGARCLDLYAGSGALGLEALSRGAASVVFVEQQREVADALRVLLQQWGAAVGEVRAVRARDYLAATVPQTERFDMVFVDPPFAASAVELAATLPLLAQRWLKPGARLYVEHARSDPAVMWPEAAWRELRTGTAGEVRYHLLEAANGQGVGRT